MTSFGMPLGKKSPKSELHEFYQMHPGNPEFAVKALTFPPAEPLFQCDLKCPAIGGANGLSEQTFVGQGRNKKAAEQYAAELALDFLRTKGLIAPVPMPMAHQELPPDLQRQLVSASTDSTTMIRLQAQALAQERLRASLLAKSSSGPLTPSLNGINGSGNGTAISPTKPDDFDSLDKEALITRLREATRENKRLKAEVEAEEQRKKRAVDLLLGMSNEQDDA